MDLVSGKIRKMLLALVIGLGVFCSFPKAFADRFNTESSSSTAALGMGNAFINTGRGPYSVFYNPANLAAKDTKTIIQPVNLQFDGNSGLMGLGFNSATAMSLSGLYSTLKTDPNNYVSSRFSVYPNITMQYLSFGLLYEVKNGAEVRGTDNALNVRVRDRFIPNAALSFRLFHGVLRIGASLQLVTVGDADTSIAAPGAVKSLSYATYTKSGSGISKNLGATVSLPFRFLPSFSIVGRDLGSTAYKYAALMPFGTGGTPETQKMSFDFAASATVYLARRIELKAELDYKDMTNTLVGSPIQHIFTGADFVFFDLLHLRAGMAHGYFSGGVGLNGKKASIDLSIYSDELGSALRGHQDQRYTFQFTWGIF